MYRCGCLSVYLIISSNRQYSTSTKHPQWHPRRRAHRVLYRRKQHTSPYLLWPHTESLASSQQLCWRWHACVFVSRCFSPRRPVALRLQNRWTARMAFLMYAALSDSARHPYARMQFSYWRTWRRHWQASHFALFLFAIVASTAARVRQMLPTHNAKKPTDKTATYNLMYYYKHIHLRRPSHNNLIFQRIIKDSTVSESVILSSFRIISSPNQTQLSHTIQTCPLQCLLPRESASVPHSLLHLKTFLTLPMQSNPERPARDR